MKHPVSGLVRLLLLLGVMGIGSRSWAQAPASPAITGATPTLDFKFTTVDVPGARLTALNGISEAGIIVGEYFEPNGGPSHGFKLEGKVITKIDAPNGTNTACARISPNGLLIVGSYLSGRTLRTGYLYKN